MPVHFDEGHQLKRLDELRKREAERFVMLLSSRLNIPYIDLTTISINPDALILISEKDSRAGKLVAFRKAGQNLDIALESPDAPETKTALEQIKKLGFNTTLYLTTENSLLHTWKYYEDIQKIEKTKTGQIDISGEDLAKFAESIHTFAEAKAKLAEMLGDGSPSKITAVLEVILASAITLSASDIHIEPEEKSVRLRLRLDGILQDLANCDEHIYKLLLSRVKLLSALKLNVESTRQDGRFSVKLGEADIDIRTSIIPGAYGEAAVMRVLNPESTKTNLNDLGMSTMLQEIMRKELKKPNGLILNTGPTGSGKTTTLYTFLREVNEPGSKIITIEDPIEYHIKGVVQTQVSEKKGYTFFEGLKSAMRQDPDIIMVGEIRDSETASTAVDAALTGHLVFSTLHTNNAAGTIPRLLDLGVNSKVLGPALNVAMAQRLVRTLCEKCKKEDAVTEHERAVLTKIIPVMAEIEIVVTMPEKLFHPVGCIVCNNSGYKSRIGIHEVILVNEEIEKLIVENPNEYEIMRTARSQKIPRMEEDGILKVLAGRTTIEELERVVDLS